MVFEELIPVRLAERKPWDAMFLAFLYSSVAVFLALWVFPAYAAIVAVFLTTLACVPMMLQVIGLEKEKEEHVPNYISRLLKDSFSFGKQPHEHLIPFFAFLFLGMALAFSFWFVVLPQNLVNDLFYVQMNTIKDINTSIAGKLVMADFFGRIFFHNIRVLAFCVLFSFIYGAGAIFILAWNASVIGTAIGDSMRRAISYSADAVGITSIAGYSSAISASLARYLTHGIPEIMGYYIGSLAGGIISMAVIKHELGSERFENTMRHATGLIMLAIAVLVIAAVLEVTISPLIAVK